MSDGIAKVLHDKAHTRAKGHQFENLNSACFVVHCYLRPIVSDFAPFYSQEDVWLR